MAKFRFAASIAFLVALLVAPLPALAQSPPAPHAYVYLGKVGDAGRMTATKFDGVPVLKVSNERTTDVQLDKVVSITANEGMALRAAPAPTGDRVGRLPSGSRVRLTGVHASFGHVWGEVDLSGTKVLAMLIDIRSPARDGFTGRSGYGPIFCAAAGSAHRRC